MLRQIIIPEQKRIVLELPDDYLHQEVEILAFLLRQPDDSALVSNLSPDPLAVFDPFQGSFDGQFNRDELYDR
jgi:hypothetical protein